MKSKNMIITSFYRDPLAAAWMADKFGFRFGDQRTAYPIPFCHDVIDEDRLNGRPEKYYVHAESIHLLKPLAGDIGIAANGDLCRHSGDGWRSVETEGGGAMDRIQIIRRNGIPFMWPETEEPTNKPKPKPPGL